MKGYFHWSLRQLYLFFFWPTQFDREAPGESFKEMKARLWYLLRLLPWITFLSIISVLITGKIIELAGVPYNLESSWFGLGFGIIFGVGFGIVVSVVVGIMGGVTVGTIIGILSGLAGASDVDLILSTTGKVTVGIVFGVMIGVIGGLAVRAGLTGSIIVGIAYGILGYVVFGLITDMRSGLVAGIIWPITFWLIYFRLASYPIDATLSLATYFLAKRQPNKAEMIWRWCPVTWNEIIWLPLPFVTEFLALLTKQNREEGFRQIAFVAAERELQIRAARAALVEIVLDDLHTSSIEMMANTTEKLSWTTIAPTDLPHELQIALPCFDRTAQHVGQYIALYNQYRKVEVLNTAIIELGTLQRSLIILRGRNAPRLLQTANEWRRRLDTERLHVKSLVEASREIPNPFVFGNPVRETEHNIFSGRRDIVKQIEASILGAHQTPTLLLHGPRRMGKTSILNQLPRLLGPDFASAVVDCQSPAVMASAASLLRYVSRSLSEGLRQRRVQISPLTAASMEREPFAVFDEWLDAAEHAMPTGLHALLCLDEYEGLREPLSARWGAAVLDLLRNILQHRPRWVLMFTGAHTFAELGPAWTDRFISARRVRVSFLTREELLPLLTVPIPEFDMTYAPGAIDAILDATNGQPFLTQAIAFELVQLLNEAERKQAMLEDIEQAIRRALVSGGEYFANVWSDAGGDGQMILRAIIKHELPPDFPAARQWLHEHDVLDATGQFAVPMVRRWVQEKMT